MGLNLGYKSGDLPVTEDVSRRLLRLPFYNTITSIEQNNVLDNIKSFFASRSVVAV